MKLTTRASREIAYFSLLSKPIWLSKMGSNMDC